MRVLHVSPSFYPAHVYGGTIQSGYHLCRSLSETASCDVRVLTTDSNGPGSVMDIELGRDVVLDGAFRVRYCHKIARNSTSPEFLRVLREYIRWADVVHLTAVYNFTTIPTLVACRLLNKPLVWSPRGALQRWKGSTNVGAKRVWELACRLVAPRRLVLHVTSEEEAVESRERIRGAEVAIVPNGVNVSATCRPHTRAGSLRLLYIGRLHEKKGIENLITACHLLSRRADLDWRLTIAGNGEPSYVRTLVGLIAGAGLTDRVALVGEVIGEAKEELFSNADIAVIPSFTENFGIVVAEALAHGVPVIASKGTPWSAVEEVGCGRWVENDGFSIARAIEEMIATSLVEAGERGRSWMEREFTWLSRGREIRSLYDALAN